MFYLLKDNRIIEIDNAEFDEFGLLKVYEKTGIYTLLKLDGTAVKYSTYFVENQSENVFDLISWERDLVKTSGGIIIQLKWLNWKERDELLESDDITEIYKPNEKGDYIKVWEKKK